MAWMASRRLLSVPRRLAYRPSSRPVPAAVTADTTLHTADTALHSADATHLLPTYQPSRTFFHLLRRKAGSNQKTVKEIVTSLIEENKIVVFSKTTCPYSEQAKEALKSVGVEDFRVIELNERDDGPAIQAYMQQITGSNQVPRVFIDGNFIGGGSETSQMAANGQLKKLINGN